MGFRPGRSAHDALRKCQTHLEDGYVWAVDMDLEKFFDTVNQSKLIEILSKDMKDGRVISLIHKYPKAGAVWCGRFEETEIGVPQGGPLSPLCANIMLNELDHELLKRGHRFIRYADDLVILCKSESSARQTLEHIIPYVERKLFLKVNRDAETNPDGILEALETGEDEIPEFGEAGNQPLQRRDPCQHKKRLLANSQQPNPENCPIQPKVRKERIPVFQFLLQICHSVN